jgi:maltose/maltodextrin transport system permease protein
MAQPLFGVMLLALGAGILAIFGTSRAEAWRFIFPGFAAIIFFVLFPVIYTIWLGFTNYSSFNLLTYGRAVEVLLSNKTVDKTTEQPFAVTQDGDAYRLWFPDTGLLSDPVALTGGTETAALSPASEPATLLPTRDAIRLRDGLQALDLTSHLVALLPDPGIRPVDRVRHGGTERRRARAKRQDAARWTWRDDEPGA